MRPIAPARRLLALATIALATACVTLPDPPLAGPLEQRVDAVAGRLERVRGAAFERRIPAVEQGRDAALEAMKKEIDEDWEEIGAGTERAWKALGLVAPDLDLHALLGEFLAASVAGYYDPDTRTFYLVRDEARREEDAGNEHGEEDAAHGDSESADARFVFTVAHELTHALDDQRFDLEALQDARKHDDDRSLALSCLVEGSAMEGGVETTLDRFGVPTTAAGPLLSPFVGLLGRLARNDDADVQVKADDDETQALLERTPPILRRSLVLPYLQGWAFVNRIRSEYGWGAVDDLFADPPDSSEQILHPERYFDRRDRPRRIVLPDPPAGYERTFENRLGAFGLQVLLDEALGGFAPDDADAWDGDRYQLWRDEEGREALVWAVALEEDDDADDLAEDLEDLLEDAGDDPSTCGVRARGELVLFVRGARPGDAEALLERLAAETHVERSPDDAPPEPAWRRWLLFPVAWRGHLRSDELDVLGGHLLQLRAHAAGWRLSLLDRLLLFAENGPERSDLWLALGLVGFTRDHAADAAWGRIPLVFAYHARGDGEAVRRGWALGPFGPIAYENLHGKRRFSLLWDLLLSVRTGPDVARGERVRLLLVPIPGL